ncbi:hypothetical protein SynA18461_01992 [Synechococcus sp. A18-46.1]|nr:hypothetical protein SynA18461_01992 [Synechococcus sp. A18-46.1]
MLFVTLCLGKAGTTGFLRYVVDIPITRPPAEVAFLLAYWGLLRIRTPDLVSLPDRVQSIHSDWNVLG